QLFKGIILNRWNKPVCSTNVIRILLGIKIILPFGIINIANKGQVYFFTYPVICFYPMAGVKSFFHCVRIQIIRNSCANNSCSVKAFITPLKIVCNRKFLPYILLTEGYIIHVGIFGFSEITVGPDGLDLTPK